MVVVFADAKVRDLIQVLLHEHVGAVNVSVSSYVLPRSPVERGIVLKLRYQHHTVLALILAVTVSWYIS
jgi:hypothetical protein